MEGTNVINVSVCVNGGGGVDIISMCRWEALMLFVCVLCVCGEGIDIISMCCGGEGY